MKTTKDQQGTPNQILALELKELHRKLVLETEAAMRSGCVESTTVTYSKKDGAKVKVTERFRLIDNVRSLELLNEILSATCGTKATEAPADIQPIAPLAKGVEAQ